MNSAIYNGIVTHKRQLPREHGFSFRLSFLYIDLSEINQIFNKRLFWSVNASNLVSFHETDYLPGHNGSLAEAVRNEVEQRTGRRPHGSIRLLTGIRHLGFAMNPLSIFYIFNKGGDQLEYILAEVSNTPWNERHCYLLVADNMRSLHQFEHPKEFHVSPFMTMDHNYHWVANEPADNIKLGISCARNDIKTFHAGLTLRRHEITGVNLARALVLYSLMSFKIIAGIYWHALRLYLKKIRFVPHPGQKLQLQSVVEERVSHEY